MASPNRFLDIVHKTSALGLISVTLGLAYFTGYESVGIVSRRITGQASPAAIEANLAKEKIDAAAAAAATAAATAAEAAKAKATAAKRWW
jgi:hypothetical protein